MEKSKQYNMTRFSAEVLKEAQQTLRSAVDEKSDVTGNLLVEIDDARWNYDTEDEFYADYRRSNDTAYFWRSVSNAKLEVTAESKYTSVSVRAPDRFIIEKVFDIFEANLADSLLPEPPQVPKHRPTIFHRSRS